MILNAIMNLMNLKLLLLILMGTASGIVIGCLPGLTSTMGVALLLPLTFGMDAANGILLLIGIYIGAVYGGSISAILLRTPGTPASAATAIDGYALSSKGESGRALGISTVSSFGGGMISALALMFISPLLAKLALKFTAQEYFALALFGLSIIASISGKSIIKGLISGTLGLIIAMIGVDPITGQMRYTFDSINLMNGISFIPIMIGLFALSQFFIALENTYKNSNEAKIKTKKILKVFPEISDLKKIFPTIIRSGLIGTFIGIIPGAGADIGAFISYNEAKRFSKNPEEFGKGAIEGIAAPESGNNGVTGGALVPLLTLGIPGDAVAAIMLGALMMQGIQPGPLLFKENGELAYTIFLGLLVANVVMLILGLLGIRIFTQISKIPKKFLYPTIFILCIVGAYGINNSSFDIVVMIVSGIIAYFMEKFEFPSSPVVLALILGPMAESNLRRSLVMSQGDYSTFFTRPFSLFFIILAIFTLFLPIIKSLLKAKNNKN